MNTLSRGINLGVFPEKIYPLIGPPNYKDAEARQRSYLTPAI